MYCSKCGEDIGYAKFCTECGTAALEQPVTLGYSFEPPGPYPTQPETGSVKKTKKITAKWWTIIGAVIFAIGAFRFVASIVALAVGPSYKPSIFDLNYKAELEAYQQLMLLAGLGAIIFLAIMLAGLTIVIINYKKIKEQK